jgi:hypothetical protein
VFAILTHMIVGLSVPKALHGCCLASSRGGRVRDHFLNISNAQPASLHAWKKDPPPCRRLSTLPLFDCHPAGINQRNPDTSLGITALRCGVCERVGWRSVDRTHSEIHSHLQTNVSLPHYFHLPVNQRPADITVAIHSIRRIKKEPSSQPKVNFRLSVILPSLSFLPFILRSSPPPTLSWKAIKPYAFHPP